jgi:NAD(P)-dependent dehydrogenase (short-subunit alcohol dehydrogenase family)
MTSRSFSLEGKVAVVTGGSRGIGFAIATTFAAHGASIVVASRKLPACEEAAARIAEATGAHVFPVKCHVGDWDDCDRLIASSLERFGRIDVLVNNAGMSPLYNSLPEVTAELFDKVIAVNLRGPFRLGVLAAEHMASAGGGSIINLSTISSLQVRAREVPYGLAKAGVNALTAALAHAYGPSVRANTIMPGPINTDVMKAWDMDEFKAWARKGIPAQRAGEADEITGAALYLASSASSYTTGATIRIDGGAAWSAG